MKFRKKPVVIEAVRFNGSSTHAAQIMEWISGDSSAPNGSGIHTRDIVPLEIETLEGAMRGDPGDWIIKGVKGEFYPCKPDIFSQTYEPVED